jgi:hypothetical protein
MNGEPATKVLAVDVGSAHVKLLATGQTEPRKIVSGPALTPDKLAIANRHDGDCPGQETEGQLTEMIVSSHPSAGEMDAYETIAGRRPVGILVRFVVVLHPQRGAILLMCTDLTLPALDVIRIYGLRFKIEVSFKPALHVIGAYLCLSLLDGGHDAITARERQPAPAPQIG